MRAAVISKLAAPLAVCKRLSIDSPAGSLDPTDGNCGLAAQALRLKPRQASLTHHGRPVAAEIHPGRLLGLQQGYGRCLECTLAVRRNSRPLDVAPPRRRSLRRYSTRSWATTCASLRLTSNRPLLSYEAVQPYAGLFHKRWIKLDFSVSKDDVDRGILRSISSPTTWIEC